MIKLILDFRDASGDNPPVIVGSQSFHAYSDPLCADKHDVAVSKFIAGRDKDLEFLASALASRLIEIKQLLERLESASDKVENDVIPDRLERFIRYLESARSDFELVNILKAYKREHF